MDLGLTGKRALVCASSRGLGLAVARALAAEGVNLILCARNQQAIEAVAKQIHEEFDVATYGMATDLAQPGTAKELALEAEKCLGGIDILVNNVGGPAPSSAAATEEAAWRNGFDQLFMSACTLTTALLPAMMNRGFGRIVSITSTAVVEPIEHLAVSTAMRSAVTAWSKLLATEVAARGVTVNLVMPGVVHTQRIEDLRRAKAQRDNTTLESEMANTAARIPAGRLGRPEELADLVCFLASSKAAYITGQNIAVDGGARKAW